MQITIKRAFAGGNTCEGSFTYLSNIIPENANRVFSLKGGPGVGKSSLMKKISRKFEDEGYDLEYYHCPSDPNSLDGIVIKDLGIVMLDGTAPHIIDPRIPGAQDDIVNLGDFLDTDALEGLKSKIVEVDSDIKDSFNRAYQYLKSSKYLYKHIEERNLSCLNLGKLNRMSEKFLMSIFKDLNSKGVYKKNIELFGSAITPVGFVDHTKDIFPKDAEVYYLDGDIGTGKTIFLQRLIERAEIKGYRVEIYHNPLIPEKIESIYIDTLNIGFTSSKQFLNNKKIDFNEFLDESLIVKYEEDIKKDKKVLDELLETAIASLKRAKANHDIIESYYVENMDFDGVNILKEEIIKKINAYKK